MSEIRKLLERVSDEKFVGPLLEAIETGGPVNIKSDAYNLYLNCRSMTDLFDGSLEFVYEDNNSFIRPVLSEKYKALIKRNKV